MITLVLVLLTTLNRKALSIPNRTFLLRFGGISGEFGRAMVRILARRSRAKIPMARPQAYHPLFVWSTVLFNGRYGYEF